MRRWHLVCRPGGRRQNENRTLGACMEETPSCPSSDQYRCSKLDSISFSEAESLKEPVKNHTYGPGGCFQFLVPRRQW